MSLAPQTTDAHPTRIRSGAVVLSGDLTIPPEAQGVILFAHGSGSSRFSPRNRFVAERLVHGHLATLLMDLLTGEEEHIDESTASFRFDIQLLAERLISAVDYLAAEPQTRDLPLGLFGASTGAAAALVAAAERPRQVAAVVSRGGRPDLAGDALARVRAPTLLIVGGADTPVIAMNRDAMSQMHCPVNLEIIPHATHLFEEPGALEKVAALAEQWFHQHLSRG